MFKKATKSQAKLRAALFGPSGAGKSYSALRIATGMGGPIAVIDTERGSASKYADRFEFDVCDLANKSIDGYVTAIKAAAGANYAVLIIDSLSHAWQELLEHVDQIAKTKYRGNSWSAWSDGTPKQKKLVDAILGFPGHVLVTMRSKTEWQTGEGKNGKSQPVRVGLAPEQGKGIEYEFDLLIEISPDHQASVIKDRTGKFQDTIIDRPGEEFGRDLAEWLSDAPPAEAPKPEPASDPQPQEPSRSENKPSEPWHSVAKAICEQANADWYTHMGIQEVQPRVRGEHRELMNVHQLTNYLCTHAIEKGAIKEDEVTKANDDGDIVRDASKAWSAIGRMYEKIPNKVRKEALAHIAVKRQEVSRDLDIPAYSDVTAVSSN